MEIPSGADPLLAEANRKQRLRLYLSGQASWYVSLGIQFVIFPFLVTQVLEEPAYRVGLAQMSLMAPAILFMLLGGSMADRSDARTILIRVHAVAALPPILLAILLLYGELSYGALIVYALAMGTLGAFAMPARDSALTRVAETGIQQAVTLAMGAQMISQLVGMLIAATAAYTGTHVLLFFQAAVMIAGGIASWRLAPLPPSHAPGTDGPLAQILDGLQVSRREPIVITVIGAMFAVGIFYVGSFLVVLPLMIRDVYHSTPDEFTVRFALVNICFWGGTIAATLVLLRTGHIERRGRVMIASLTSGAVVLALLGLPLPFWALCILIFIWGTGAGTTMTMGRTIVQLAAPDSHRARVLALYQLGFSGGAPVGSFCMGYLVGTMGIHSATLVPALIVALILAGLVRFSPLWAYRDEERVL